MTVWSRRLLGVFLGGVLGGLLLSGCAGEVGRSAEARDPDEEAWIDLFDGETLDGWTVKLRHHEVGENYANTFRAEDGLIKVRYDGYDDFGERFGHLYYDRPYSYYRLALDPRAVCARPERRWSTRDGWTSATASNPAPARTRSSRGSLSRTSSFGP